MAWERVILTLDQKQVDEQLDVLADHGIKDLKEWFNSQNMGTKLQVYDAVADDVCRILQGKVNPYVIRAALRFVIREFKGGAAPVERSHTE